MNNSGLSEDPASIVRQVAAACKEFDGTDAAGLRLEVILGDVCTSICVVGLKFNDEADVEVLVKCAMGLLRTPEHDLANLLAMRTLATSVEQIPCASQVFLAHGGISVIRPFIENTGYLTSHPAFSEELLRCVSCIALDKKGREMTISHLHKEFLPFLLVTEPLLPPHVQLLCVRCCNKLMGLAAPTDIPEMRPTHKLLEKRFAELAKRVLGRETQPKRDQEHLLAVMECVARVYDVQLVHHSLLRRSESFVSGTCATLAWVMHNARGSSAMKTSLRDAAYSAMISLFLTSPPVAVPMMVKHDFLGAVCDAIESLVSDVRIDTACTALVSSFINGNISQLPLIAEELQVSRLLEFLLCIIPVSEKAVDRFNATIPTVLWQTELEGDAAINVPAVTSKAMEIDYLGWRMMANGSAPLADFSVLVSRENYRRVGSSRNIPSVPTFVLRQPLIRGFQHARTKNPQPDCPKCKRSRGSGHRFFGMWGLLGSVPASGSDSVVADEDDTIDGCVSDSANQREGPREDQLGASVAVSRNVAPPQGETARLRASRTIPLGESSGRVSASFANADFSSSNAAARQSYSGDRQGLMRGGALAEVSISFPQPSAPSLVGQRAMRSGIRGQQTQQPTNGNRGSSHAEVGQGPSRGAATARRREGTSEKIPSGGMRLTEAPHSDAERSHDSLSSEPIGSLRTTTNLPAVQMSLAQPLGVQDLRAGGESLSPLLTSHSLGRTTRNSKAVSQSTGGLQRVSRREPRRGTENVPSADNTVGVAPGCWPSSLCGRGPSGSSRNPRRSAQQEPARSIRRDTQRSSKLLRTCDGDIRAELFRLPAARQAYADGAIIDVLCSRLLPVIVRVVKSTVSSLVARHCALLFLRCFSLISEFYKGRKESLAKLSSSVGSPWQVSRCGPLLDAVCSLLMYTQDISSVALTESLSVTRSPGGSRGSDPSVRQGNRPIHEELSKTLKRSSFHFSWYTLHGELLLASAECLLVLLHDPTWSSIVTCGDEVRLMQTGELCAEMERTVIARSDASVGGESMHGTPERARAAARSKALKKKYSKTASSGLSITCPRHSCSVVLHSHVAEVLANASASASTIAAYFAAHTASVERDAGPGSEPHLATCRRHLGVPGSGAMVAYERVMPDPVTPNVLIPPSGRVVPVVMVVGGASEQECAPIGISITSSFMKLRRRISKSDDRAAATPRPKAPLASLFAVNQDGEAAADPQVTAPILSRTRQDTFECWESCESKGATQRGCSADKSEGGANVQAPSGERHGKATERLSDPHGLPASAPLPVVVGCDVRTLVRLAQFTLSRARSIHDLISTEGAYIASMAVGVRRYVEGVGVERSTFTEGELAALRQFADSLTEFVSQSICADSTDKCESSLIQWTVAGFANRGGLSPAFFKLTECITRPITLTLQQAAPTEEQLVDPDSHGSVSSVFQISASPQTNTLGFGPVPQRDKRMRSGAGADTPGSLSGDEREVSSTSSVPHVPTAPRSGNSTSGFSVCGLQVPIPQVECHGVDDVASRLGPPGGAAVDRFAGPESTPNAHRRCVAVGGCRYPIDNEFVAMQLTFTCPPTSTLKSLAEQVARRLCHRCPSQAQPCASTTGPSGESEAPSRRASGADGRSAAEEDAAPATRAGLAKVEASPNMRPTPPADSERRTPNPRGQVTSTARDSRRNAASRTETHNPRSSAAASASEPAPVGGSMPVVAGDESLVHSLSRRIVFFSGEQPRTLFAHSMTVYDALLITALEGVPPPAGQSSPLFHPPGQLMLALHVHKRPPPLQFAILKDPPPPVELNASGCTCVGLDEPVREQMETTGAVPLRYLCSHTHLYSRMRADRGLRVYSTAMELLDVTWSVLRKCNLASIADSQRRLYSAVLYQFTTHPITFSVPSLMYTLMDQAVVGSLKSVLPTYALYTYPQIFPLELRRALFDLLRNSRLNAAQQDAYQSRRGMGSSLRQSTAQNMMRNELSMPLSATVAASLKVKLVVERRRVLEHGLQALRRYASVPLPFDIQFAGEEGVGLGPTLEFYSLLCKEFSRQANGMWRLARDPLTGEVPKFASGYLFPAPVITGKTLSFFRDLGILFGRALMEGRVINLKLHPLLWRTILGEDPMSDARCNLAQVDPELENSLQLLESMSADALTLTGLSFTYIFENPDGSPQEKPLYPGSEEVMVTQENVQQYTHQIRESAMGKPLRETAVNFVTGLSHSLKSAWLLLFTAAEVAEILNGAQGRLWDSEEAFAKVVVPAHGYTSSSPVVHHFIAVVGNWTAVRQRQFLKFISGSDCIPATGLEPPITVVRRDTDISQLLQQPRPSLEPLSQGGLPIADGDGNEIAEGSYTSSPLLGDSQAPPAQVRDSFSMNSRAGGGWNTSQLDASRVDQCASLPTVNTCFHYLKLPNYPSREVLEAKLLMAITEGQGQFLLS